MDGFEVNGLRLFSLSIPEPSVKNLFTVNEFYRNNDDFINPDLQERLVIGDDSISIFTYDIKVTFLKLEIILAPKIYSVRLVISLHS